MQSPARVPEETHIILQLEELGFVKISDFPMEDFVPFQRGIAISDLSYALLYAWETDYLYRIRIINGNPVIVGFDVPGTLFFSVIPVHAGTLMQTVEEMIGILSAFGVDFLMKYIAAEDVPLFEEKGFRVEYSADFSDYVYDAAEFVNLNGKKNSSKRHEYNRFVHQNPDCRYADMTPENDEDTKKIFDKWCAEHSCAECIWGCERNAYLRLLELVRRYPAHYCGGIVYLGNEPVSFGIAERINDRCVCYHVQKNAVSAGGLTYFLHYHMALRHTDIPLINWGEDMGLEGLRANKQKYHPSHMEVKYEIRFHAENPEERRLTVR